MILLGLASRPSEPIQPGCNQPILWESLQSDNFALLTSYLCNNWGAANASVHESRRTDILYVDLELTRWAPDQVRRQDVCWNSSRIHTEAGVDLSDGVR